MSVKDEVENLSNSLVEMKKSLSNAQDGLGEISDEIKTMERDLEDLDDSFDQEIENTKSESYQEGYDKAENEFNTE